MASANTLLTPTVIAKETLMQVTNNLGMAQHVYRAYKNEFTKIGGTVTVRKPNKFRATKTQARSNTDLVEPSTSITVATQAHVTWAFSSVELTQTIEDYSKRYIAPAAAALANQVDDDLCDLYKDVANYAGTPGTTPSTFKALGDCQIVLDNEGAPQEGRVAVVNPTAHWTLADGLKGTFAPKVADSIMTKGYLGTVANLSIYMDQNIAKHTTGAFESDIVLDVTTAQTTGDTSVVTKNWGGSSTITDGDIFTIAGVYGVNPMSGTSTGVLKRFNVTANTADVSTAMTIPFAPTISYVASGAYNNVNALGLDDAVVSFVGTASTSYTQNLVFHPNAFCLVTLPIEMPSNVWGARETDTDAGISIRVVKQYDIDADEEIIRMDILYGMQTLYPELACRLWGE